VSARHISFVPGSAMAAAGLRLREAPLGGCGGGVSAGCAPHGHVLSCMMWRRLFRVPPGPRLSVLWSVSALTVGSCHKGGPEPDL
jgi:hypothetical protein